MVLYDLLTPSVFQLFNVVGNLLRAFAYLVAAGVNEIYDAVQMPYIPPTAVLVHKFGKRTVKFPEIRFELPLRLLGGNLLVENTAPST